MNMFNAVVQSLRSRMLCETYEVGWDFVISRKQQQQPHPNLAASHTGEDTSFLKSMSVQQQ